MKFIIGKDRKQTCLFPISLEDSIESKNSVRSIDQFVDSLNLAELGFRSDFIENGPPAYDPSVLLKLYIYGYMNRIGSSRQLEKECRRNIEVIWLLESLTPDHNTISNFRKDNTKAIKKVFFATVKIAHNFGAYNLTRIWNILRETNTYIFKTHKFFIALIGSPIRCLEVFWELNSKIKSRDSTNTKNCNLVETLKIAVGY